jgi:glucose/mannose transport system substrate-binding protein
MRLARPGKRGLLQAVCAAALVGACGSSSGPSAPRALVVLNWLTADSEANALDALFHVVESRYAGVSITNAAEDQSAVAQQELATQMAQGNPPDSFQVVSGSSLDYWVEKEALEPLDSLAAAQGWTSVIPAPVLESVSRNGSLYGVPLDIERDNTLFFNKQVFAAHGVTPPTGIGDFLTVAEALDAKGVTPFAVSAYEGWTIASTLFEAVLVAQAGPDFYQAYLTGKKSADNPEMRVALGTLGQMMGYANADRMSTQWADAVADVCSGKAAMLVMPDFAKGELANDGCDASKVGYVPMQPAGTPSFVFVSITFELPNGAPHRDAAIQFLETVGSEAGQAAFNPIKGSIPARTDVPSSLFDELSVKTQADFTAADERLVPGYAALTSPNFQAAISAALQNFVDPAGDNSVDVAMTALSQNYNIITQL